MSGKLPRGRHDHWQEDVWVFLLLIFIRKRILERKANLK